MQAKKQLKVVKPTEQKQIVGGHIGDGDGPQWIKDTPTNTNTVDGVAGATAGAPQKP